MSFYTTIYYTPPPLLKLEGQFTMLVSRIIHSSKLYLMMTMRHTCDMSLFYVQVMMIFSFRM